MIVLCVFLGIACYFDYRYCRIPNKLIVIALAVGLCKSYLSGNIGNVFLYFSTVLLMSVLLFPIYKIGGLGAGDVKLFGMCAGYLPWDKILLFFFFSMLISACISIVQMIRARDLMERAAYFVQYVIGVLSSKKVSLYLSGNTVGCRGVRLAGPALCSALLYMCGVY